MSSLYIDAENNEWFPENVLNPLAQQLAGDKLSRLMPEALRVVISKRCGGTAWAVRIVCEGYRFQNIGARGDDVVGMGPAPPPDYTVCSTATTSRLVLAKFRRGCESGEAADAALPEMIQLAGNAGEADSGGASRVAGEICTSMHLEGPASRCLLAHGPPLRALSREATRRHVGDNAATATSRGR
jgi:hypothetical protein